MAAVKQRWNKTDGVQLYHVIQSFRPGELSPELALEIAREFTREHLPGYQAVIGVHTDREHIHAHTLLYLGGNESSTHKYISEALGKSTIDTKTHGQTKGRSGSYSTNFQMSGRELLTPDEVRMLDNRYCILFIRGARPVLDLKYELMEHPAIRYTMDGGAPPYIHHGTATPTLPGEPLFRFDQNDEKENIA